MLRSLPFFIIGFITLIMSAGCSVYESPARKYLESNGYIGFLKVAAVNADGSCTPITDDQLDSLKAMSPDWWDHNALRYDDQLHSYFVCPTEPQSSEH